MQHKVDVRDENDRRMKMTRGIRMEKRKTSKMWVRWLTILALALPSGAFAGSAKRALRDDTGKIAPPTKEDSADYFANSRQGVSPEDAKKADDLRGKTIDQIKSMLANAKTSNTFELMLRLGELYVERSQYQRDIEINAWLDSHEKWKKADAKTRGKAPTVNYKASESQVHLAISAFRKLVSTFPKHPQTDAALLALANTLSKVEDENALLYYKQLIKNHPKSLFIPDAWLAIGEFHFDKHNIKEATEAYKNVMEYKEHRAYAFAVYKLGWCYYNSQGVREKNPGDSLKKSIAAFKLVVKLAEKSTDKRNFNLREEAIRDLIMAFAETEDTDAAWKYFKTIGEEEKFYVMLERLGNAYTETGRNQKAIEVFQRLVTEAPTKKNNPRIYQKLVELYDAVAQQDQSVANIKIMHQLFLDPSSKWASSHTKNPEILADAKDLTERVTHRYGTLFHSRGQKTKNKSLEANAGSIYEMYLLSFSSSEKAYEIRYYLADIQLEQKNYVSASENFMKVAKQKPKDGKHLKESALSAVTAIAKLNEGLKTAPLPPAAQVPKPISIPKQRALYTSVIDQYVQLLPEEKDGHSMRYTAAQIFFDYGHYDEAIKRFDSIADTLSATKQGQTSARVVVGFFNEKSNWTKVIEYGKKYQTNKKIMADAGVKKFIEDSLRSALFNSAMGFEKSKEFDKAASGFLEFQKMFPHDPNADRAVYNASINFFKGGKIEDALTQQKRLLKEYPKSSLGADVTVSMGTTYESLAQFQDAANTYRTFAKSWPTDKRSPNALFNAGVLYRGVKQPELASASFYELFRAYPTHEASNDALFEAARIRESSGDKSGAISAYNEYIKIPSNLGKDNGLYAQAKIIELKLSVNQDDKTARSDLGKLSSSLRAKNAPPAFEARRITAKIMFEQQEANFNSFKALRLSDGSKIEKLAKEKQGKLEIAAPAYERIIALGNAEYAVASLYRLGEMHEDFAKALFEAPAPSGSTQAQANSFKSQLEKVAFPLKNEAYKFFETAYKRSQEVESFSAWTSKTYQKMVELAPEKHKELTEQSGSPKYMSYKVSITSATEDLTR
jgi:TolA-binding protein